jgi:uncharacterized membrane protein
MADLKALWARLTDSLWFVPVIVVLAAVALALAMVELSAMVDPEALARYPRIFGAGAEGSRSIRVRVSGPLPARSGVS